MGFLKSKQRSTNMEQKFVNDTFKPAATALTSQGQGGLAQYLATLSGDTDALRRFETASGYDDVFDESQRAVTGSAAARGLLNSGATVRALADRGAQLKRQSLAQYLQQLLQGSQVGLAGGQNAGNLVANVGAQNERAGGLGGIVNAFKDIGSIGKSVASTVANIKGL